MYREINGKEAWIEKSKGNSVQWRLFGLDWQELTDKEFFFWDNSRFVDEDSNYFFRIVEDNKMLGNCKIRVNNEAETEQGLISGADAKLAWAKGESVQRKCSYTFEWKDITSKDDLRVFDFGVDYRIKPRTITLNVEIPAPFEPKESEVAWCLDGNTLNGYKKVICEDFIDSGIGFWRTEEEIKQVVAALRGALK